MPAQNAKWKSSKCTFFAREGTFRLFALPAEIRYQVLELLLVRNNVALAPDRMIKDRFPHWNHERPSWVLLHINCQLRAEAISILFSAKTTFFLPLREIDVGTHSRSLSDLLGIPEHLIPTIKKLDCAFDRRDATQTGFLQLELSSLSACETSMERDSRDERNKMLHDAKVSELRDVWQDKIEALLDLKLDVLRLDVTHSKCLFRCCRLAWCVLEALYLPTPSREDIGSKRIEVFGALQEERDEWAAIMQNTVGVLRDDVIFVDTPGCTCVAKPRAASSA
ncbi:hypothetical protein MMC28_007237 [Mycoblastus sanguinarius]|nr:hypothetical protein [Mycoblastus sanguinarius]